MHRMLLSILTLLSAAMAGVYSEISNSEPDFIEQQKLTSNLIVNMFMLDVDKGKLAVFDQTLKRSQLISHQVAYVHNLDDDSLTISIHLQLKEGLLIPHFEDYLVDAISVEVDEDGRIKEIRSHVVPAQ